MALRRDHGANCCKITGTRICVRSQEKDDPSEVNEARADVWDSGLRESHLLSPIPALRKYQSCSRFVDEFLFLECFQNGTSSKLISRDRSFPKLVGASPD